MDDQMEGDETRTYPSQSFSVATHETMSQFDGEDSEDDNEIELELTAEYMSNGYSDMETGDLPAAEENFRSALELAEEHDFSGKLDYGPGDITLILADCLTKQEKEEEALELLEPIADGVANRAYSDVVSVQAGSGRDAGRDQITQLKACHTLGLIFLNRADTHAAEKRAQQAFKGRRRVCGAHDPATLESVQLLIDIYTTKNDKTKARAYRRFLEPSSKGRTAGPTLSKISAVPPVLPPVFQPTATATLTEPAPTTLETSDADMSIPAKSIELDPTTPTKDSLQATTNSPLLTYTPKISSSAAQPTQGAETENEPRTLTAPEAVPDLPALQLSDSIRAALQTASISSTLPSFPVVTTKPTIGTASLSSTLTHAQTPSSGSISKPLYSETSEDQVRIPSPVSVALPASPQKNIVTAELSNSPAHTTVDDSKSTRSLPLSDSTVTLHSSITAKPVSTPERKAPLASNPTVRTSQPMNIAPKAESASMSLAVSDAISNVSSSPKLVGPAKVPSLISRSSSSAKASSPRRKEVPVRSPVFGVPSTTNTQPPIGTIANTSPMDPKAQATSKARMSPATTLPEPSSIDFPKPPTHAPPSSSNYSDDVSSVRSPASLADGTAAASTDTQARYPIIISTPTSDAPTSTVSASQAAFAAIFASSGGKPPKKLSPSTRADSPAAPSIKAEHVLSPPALSHKLSTLSQETLTALPLTRDPASARTKKGAAVHTETPEEQNTSQQEETPIHLRSFSWLPDTKLSMPSSIARVMSSSAAPGQKDAVPNRIFSSATVKRKAWPLQLGKNKPEPSKKEEPKAAQIPVSVDAHSMAGSDTISRRDSISTLGSNVEPKRYISITAAGLTSQPLKLLNKEISLGIERISKTSLSRSYSSSLQSTPRTRQDLAPKFMSIKTLREEGKKSVSIDAAIRLLREYDVERRILAVREGEIKKNMRESEKGLASTGYGYAPIHFFCEQKKEAALEVELLIEQGVDVNAVAFETASSAQEPFTPLQRAIENGHVEIVRLLVDADVAMAPPRAQNGAGTTGLADRITHPLLLACTKGHTEITKIMLNGGAARLLKEFPHRQWHGNSLLHEACWLADIQMVQMLLNQLLVVRSQYHPSAGPDYESGVIGAPGQQDRFGATPMMYAVDLRDCTSEHMRLQKSARRRQCLKLLLEHEIHGDLHSQEYRDNIARVLSTKWTRGPGKGHSIFCYCDEAGDDELIRLLDPFRYQVSPSARCHATPQCTPNTGSILRNGSVKSGATDRQNRMPEFPELMSVPVSWPVSANQDGGHYELASNFGSSLPEFEQSPVILSGMVNGTIVEEPLSPVTARSNSNGHGHGNVNGIKERFSELSETSNRSSALVV